MQWLWRDSGWRGSGLGGVLASTRILPLYLALRYVVYLTARQDYQPLLGTLS